MNKSFAALVLVLFGATGCVSAQVLGNTDLGNVNFLRLSELKRGEACRTAYLGIFRSGSEDIRVAAEQGEVANVKLVEKTTEKLTGIYQKNCTVVYGN